METYIREEKTYMDGMPCPFLCHLQTAEGEGSVYPAHYHSYIEMLFGLSGEFQIYLNELIGSIVSCCSKSNIS